MEGKKKAFCLGLIIIVAATFFRFYKIDQTAPFLGDQGRDLLEIRASITAGRLPLVGPLSNFGVHAGPIYYYLAIPPLVLANFYPLGPILFFTFFGVISSLLIFLIAKNLFGTIPAFFAALLYACSPQIVQQNLGFWNPIPIPLFSLLIIWALYQIKEQKKLAWLIPLGIFSGIVIQFYPPAFYILAVVVIWLARQRLILTKWTLAGLAGFLLTLLPFLIFQLQNNFADVKNLLLLVLEKFLGTGASTVTQNHSFLNSFSTILADQFQAITALPFWPLNLLLGVIILISGWKNYWHRFFTFWFLAGVFLISLYPGTVHEHYASPIWAIPFLLFASFLSQLMKRLPQRLVFALVALLVCWQAATFFKNFSANKDLGRSQAAANAIVKIAGNQSFALLLLPDRSPSDAHLRYFLNLKRAPLQKIGTTGRLLVVCESDPCPKPAAMRNLKIVDSACLPNCAPLDQQRTINLSDWRYLTTQNFLGGKVYLFEAAQAGQN
ncbi:hypothetical protein COT65_02115 [Candidatus Shapirobacteria bacterium CG09_land_8_20_14_0_10_47_13]|uniref:Glycosyltransferase RgtA/B/C/D-like domain-containing protein n=1 Tax=Candidatus Shapirobacteria bacterium CG09_land_8_20_14_0_10_47_13 TaxID=1974481 RepID=A0A2H0WMC9_9BACT|nr:MAG: hypothetical protein COT65_02115 [Candidatus Shapirobacteria bacterium CG09_land_8_20_14_0_10_47_13]